MSVCVCVCGCVRCCVSECCTYIYCSRWDKRENETLDVFGVSDGSDNTWNIRERERQRDKLPLLEYFSLKTWFYLNFFCCFFFIEMSSTGWPKSSELFHWKWLLFTESDFVPFGLFEFERYTRHFQLDSANLFSSNRFFFLFLSPSLWNE